MEADTTIITSKFNMDCKPTYEHDRVVNMVEMTGKKDLPTDYVPGHLLAKLFHSQDKSPTSSVESYLNIPDMGLHYPFYSRKCFRNFQSPENGEVRDQPFEEEVLKTYKIKDRDPACSLHITGEKHATLKKF